MRSRALRLGRASSSTLPLACLSLTRAFSAFAASHSPGHYDRSDFTGQGFTGIYEPGQPPSGPLAGASLVGAPKVHPRTFKHLLDQHVVGQERAKKKLSTAIYNHYQRIEELQRREDERAELEAQARRREMAHRHPLEDEFPGQQMTVSVYPPPSPSPDMPPSAPESLQIAEDTPLDLDKSNVLLLGPSGVGKTLMVKTLAKVLRVPFSISDCTSFTQAGYIGEDAEVCVQRLLAKADYDVARAERGIVFLDEFDKIATTKMAHGKDVGGEGVQQALLGIIEGTTLQIPAKQERGTNGRSHGGPSPPGGKGELLNVRTDNILFILAGAFVNLPKIILERISQGSIGFGASVRSSKPDPGAHESILKGEDALFRKHLPFYVAPESNTGAGQRGAQHLIPSQQSYNILDLVEPTDLQRYGMIPELIGRIPSICALSALDEEALVRVLVEPRDSVLRKLEQQFKNSGIELRFTSAALREVAKQAIKMGTGARGLRAVLERLLEESNYGAPGTFVKHILVTRDVAQLKSAPLYFDRGQTHSFHATLAQEEDAWESETTRQDGPAHVSSFLEYRKQAGGHS